MRAYPAVKQVLWLLAILLLGLLLSACSVPMKESEKAADTSAAPTGQPETKAPGAQAKPRLKYVVSANIIQELVYDAEGHVCQTVERQISTSGEQSWLETETVSFDRDGSVIDYRQEGVPREQQDPDVQIRMEGKQLITATQGGTITREYENGQLVLLLINTEGYNLIIQYERNGDGQLLQQISQTYWINSQDPEKKIYDPAQVRNCHWEVDSSGLPLYSWLEKEDGTPDSDLTAYYYENHPERQDPAGRLKAVLEAGSVLFLTYDPDGTVRKAEKTLMNVSDSVRSLTLETLSFDRNGDILQFRQEDPNAVFEITGNQLILGVFRLTYRQGRTVHSELSVDYDGSTKMNREIVYDMNALGLYEKMSISWYLTKPGDPERYPVPDMADSVRTFVYEYGGGRFPLWSYQTDEGGLPVQGSFVLYLFE